MCRTNNKSHQKMNLRGGKFNLFASINIFVWARQHGNNVLDVYAEKNFSNFQSKEPAICPDSENHTFRQREGTYRGLAIRWPQFAHRIGRSRRNQKLLSFQYDILCTSVLEAWNPTKLTLDQQKLLVVHRIPELFILYGMTRCSHIDMLQRYLQITLLQKRKPILLYIRTKWNKNTQKLIL